MKQIYLDSFCLHNLEAPNDFFVAPPIQGAGFPALRTVNHNRAGQDGLYVSSQFLGERRITLVGYLTQSNITTYEAQRRAFLANCVPLKDSSNALLPRTLRIKNMNGDWRRIGVQIVNQPDIPINNLLFGIFKLELLATDVAWQDDTLTQVTMLPLKRGGVHIPAAIPADFSSGGSGLKSLNNAGDIYAYPTIILNGPLTNPTIENTTTGMLMKLNLHIGAGSQVIIDMKERTIIQGGVTNIISDKTDDSVFWTIVAGNNIILFKTDVMGETGNAIAQYRNSWIGV